MTTIISANYGGWDVVQEATPQSVPCDFVYVTDSTAVAAEAEFAGWHAIVEPRPHVHPCMAAKFPKMCPWEYVPGEQGPIVWIDASATFTGNVAARANGWPIGTWPQVGLATFPHPHRDNLADELTVSRALTKYDGLPMEEQVRHYLGFGIRPSGFLRASGLLVWTRYRFGVEDFARRWLIECLRWGYQDQLSLYWMLAHRGALGVHVADFGPSLFTDPDVDFHGASHHGVNA